MSISIPLLILTLPKTQTKQTNNTPYIPSKSSKKTTQIPIHHYQSFQAQNLHAHLIKSGLVSNLYKSNTLIHCYSKSGDILYAHQLFDEMSQRNLVSWTSLISGYAQLGWSNDAVEIFIRMLNSGFSPNEFAYGSVLRSCAESGYARFGTQLHGLIVKTGFIQNVFVDSSLITMYVKNGDFDIAVGVLRRMQERDAFSWTSMVVGYSNGGCAFEALELFGQMLEEDVRPSEYTLTSVLKACAYLESLKVGHQIHGYAVKRGFEEDVSVRISLVGLYTKLRDLSSALSIYDRSSPKDVVLCTAMIGGYAQNGSTDGAIQIFSQMHEEFELVPNEFTFANVISACADNGNCGSGTCFHALAIKTGHASAVHVEGALIDMYAKTGKMEDACKVFESMEGKDAISCSSILAGFSYNGHDQEALEFYSTLHRTSVKPDPFALASATISCAKLADQLQGRQIHAQIIKHGHESDTCIASSLVDMYAKSGSIEDAQRVFDELFDRDRIAWTAMIDGYAQHGEGIRALELFERMKEEGVRPNGVTFVSILHACSHAGLVEDGLRYFNSMSSEYKIKPVIHHYACMVDLLGRAGRLEEALEFITRMPMQPTPLIWRALLGACRTHKNLGMGIYASNRLLELEPEDDATYVLLANMYTELGRWGEASRVRNLMKESGLRKVPGLSWIEVGKSFHVFGARDTIHPQKELIYKALDDLNGEMKEAGYVPETGFSLKDGDGDEKEKSIFYHSEKLAVCFGLISTPPATPIRIFKNLRVCGDCHNAMKIISLIRNRTVTVRDVSRFHHFSGGRCSCGDYW
ncbi:pentatricopeptide repeat-containing protein At3g49170, chloroplastic-like [Magnolia sinica]|uniref:pentatricopeptide repeat-containing protein At3g49170, chloroplastic-like n=1 Tax=Magnolia sinica TaxID=86752 RepID=UPI00265970CF|nr:pentatricopeptide repeat-containing protein At3g49170, chloroplastic-like [Magnolia sinica]